MEALNQRDIPENAKEVAARALYQSLDMEVSSVQDFPDKLLEATASLDRYKEIREALKNIDTSEIPLELFHLLKREGDLDYNKEEDGVLINSMKQGTLNCAGRVLVAATYLRERGIVHYELSPKGHSLLLIDIDEDSYAYCDFNHNLFFTLPKEALEVVKQGGKDITEFRLHRFSSREEDVREGVGLAYGHFLAIPGERGVVNTYLGNMQAALDGKPEFDSSDIQVNHEAAFAIQQIRKAFIDDPLVEEYRADFQNYASEVEFYYREVIDLYDRSEGNEAVFKHGIRTMLEGDLGNAFPYVDADQYDSLADSLYEKISKHIQKNEI